MLDAVAELPPNARNKAAATAHTRCQAPSGSRGAWCVVATLPRAERRAHASLHRYGYPAYLPLITTRWRDRTWHTGPLFPGYCFVRLDLSRPWSPVKHAPGVFQLLMTDGQPSICPEAAVSALQALEPFPASTCRWTAGMPCSVLLGPLAGMPAVVTQVSGERATVAVLMLGQLREVAVNLDALSPRDD